MKKYLIFAFIVIVILAGLFLPKIMKGKEGYVKFKEMDSEDVPEQIIDMLPKYLMEERALACKYRDEIYVIATRGEKKSDGFSVEIEKISENKLDKDKYELIVHVKYEDPSPDEILPQEYNYPYTIVKTKLKTMPEKVHLEVDYID